MVVKIAILSGKFAEIGGEIEMGKKITHEEYVMRVNEINPNIEVLGVYINNKTKISHRCKVCDCKWYAQPSSIVNQKTGCPECALKSRANKRTRTHEEYIEELARINTNIEVAEKYMGALTKIKHRCKIDGYQWMATPASILCGHGCPKCAQKAPIDHETYMSLLKEYNENIDVVEPYVNKMTPIKHRCKIDGCEWYVSPSSLLLGHGCPVCKGVSIGNPPEYKNSIWASEYKEYFSKYLTEEQMKNYTPHSDRKISIPCCDCGYVKNIRIADLLKYGFCCQKCGDGISYPNKFGRAFISQLNVDKIDYEYSPEWLFVDGNRCFYDIYFEHNLQSYIIEMDGELGHGNRAFGHNNGDIDGLIRDIKKDTLASSHNIEVIRIDAKKSNKEYIKNSIMTSRLPNILHFQSNDINWEECDKLATSKFVFAASDLWVLGLSICDIAKSLQVNPNTVTRYLQRASNLGKCNYTKEESHKRAGKQRSGAKSTMARKIINLQSKIIYNTLKEAATNNNIHQSTMIRYCKSHKDFMYYDEWQKMQENYEAR